MRAFLAIVMSVITGFSILAGAHAVQRLIEIHRSMTVPVSCRPIGGNGTECTYEVDSFTAQGIDALTQPSSFLSSRGRFYPAPRRLVNEGQRASLALFLF